MSPDTFMNLVRLLTVVAGFGFAVVGIVGTAAYVIRQVASAFANASHARAATYHEKTAKMEYERMMEGGRK